MNGVDSVKSKTRREGGRRDASVAIRRETFINHAELLHDCCPNQRIRRKGYPFSRAEFARRSNDKRGASAWKRPVVVSSRCRRDSAVASRLEHDLHVEERIATAIACPQCDGVRTGGNPG